MQISVSTPPYVIPTYSLTGDLLAYLKCGLQYRYQNKGSLPPSKPVQLWFGEFIHAVMEEAYLRWTQSAALRRFPWDWLQDIRPIELEIARLLASRGLRHNRNVFDDNQITNNQLIASRRTEAAINTWGAHLFPLIAEAEVRLQGIRSMPLQGQRRADYYEISGVADVIGSVQLTRAPRGNLLLNYLYNNPTVQQVIQNLSGSGYEIILDYKGMRRSGHIISDPNSPNFMQPNPEWEHYNWQVLTYSWLRGQQQTSTPVIAGILLFINELEPSQDDMVDLQRDVQNNATDIMPTGRDLQAVLSWRRGQPVPPLSTPFRDQRSIRIVTVDQQAINRSLLAFDDVVEDIELAVLGEMSGQGIIAPWEARPSGVPYIAPQERTCTGCDFKHYCPLAVNLGGGYGQPPYAP
jgi:hypothetical protein